VDTNNSAEPGMAWREIAKSAYLAYGHFVDFKNAFGGDMPKWEDLPERIRHAWEAAARQVAVCQMALEDYDIRAGELGEDIWSTWKPPTA
jgi:hypothetical protein